MKRLIRQESGGSYHRGAPMAMSGTTYISTRRSRTAADLACGAVGYDALTHQGRPLALGRTGGEAV